MAAPALFVVRRVVMLLYERRSANVAPGRLPGPLEWTNLRSAWCPRCGYGRDRFPEGKHWAERDNRAPTLRLPEDVSMMYAAFCARDWSSIWAA